MTKKANIPKAVREQCWLTTIGKKYESKCYIKWCKNNMTVFDFHVGHDQPESKGGTLDINNLKGLEIEMVYEWKVGDSLIVDRSPIHCASTRINHKKLGLTPFTKK